MTKDEFYSHVKKYKIARQKHACNLMGCIVFAYFGAKLVDMYLPFATQTPVQAGIIIASLSIPVCITFLATEKLLKKYGLECNHCRTQFSNYQQLMRIGLTNTCPKCGGNIHAA